MQLTVCGFGGAGSRLADRLVAADAAEGPSMLAGAVAIDTDPASLAALEGIPEAHRHHYGYGIDGVATVGGVGGDDERDVAPGDPAEADGPGRPDADRIREDGTLDRSGHHSGDRDRGAAAVEAHHAALSHAVTDAVTTGTDAILCCVGLAGGSGATAVPPLAAELRRVVDRPIYGLGLLPAEELPPTVAVDADLADDRREATGETRSGAGDPRGATPGDLHGASPSDPRGEDSHRRDPGGEDPPEWAVNAGRALEELTVATDSLLCFDTADWLRSGESIDDPAVRRRCNDDLARRVATLFRAGEVDPDGPIAERVVDTAELKNTFDAGGIATLGYASQTVERPRTSRFGLGLFERAGEVETTAAIKAVDTTVRRAVRGKLSVEVDRASTSRGLLIVGGPPEWLNREAVSSARAWLTEETASVQIRTGDMPTPEGSAVLAVVLLTGCSVCPRTDALRQCAERARRRTR